MRKFSYSPYAILMFFLLLVLSLPEKISEKMRIATISFISPSWESLHTLKSHFSTKIGGESSFFIKPLANENSEIEKLKKENTILRSEIETICNWLFFKKSIDEDYEKFQTINSCKEESEFWKSYFKRRSAHLAEKLSLSLRALPAKVIYREPVFWTSSIWINVGIQDNEALGQEIVAKDSPVVVGSSIVGVVEYVGKQRSRVRLLTDAKLVPSVRAIRGKEQNKEICEHLDIVLTRLTLKVNFENESEKHQEIIQTVERLKELLKEDKINRFLAKGELHGSSKPLWRAHDYKLKGIGFNYDFPDEEGPSRELQTGLFQGEEPIPLEKEAILKVGDLLITTGMDGIFPEGFYTAVVETVDQIKEGASAYELTARLTAGNLNELRSVFVLPPLSLKN